MRHARSDYNRIQDPALSDPSLLGTGSTPIEEDEPVFLLRAQDLVAPESVESWAAFAEGVGADPVMVAMARSWAEEMREWRKTRWYKVPDLST